MSRYGARRAADESGAVAVLVAVLSVVVFGLAAVVVDLGFARDVSAERQAAADAAALAGNNVVYASGTAVPDIAGAVAAAKAYAKSNGATADADWASCTDPRRPAGYVVPAGSTPCISFHPDLARPSRIRVALPDQQTPSFFAGIVGVNPPLIRAAAESSLRINRQAPCALCILRTGTTHDLSQGNVRVRGGAISFNGNLTVGSNGVAAADGPIFVEGTVGGSVSSASPTPTTGSPRQADPLAAYPLPQPPTYGLPATVKTDPCAQGPGIYGSVTFPSSGTCTLSPGLYVVAGTSTTGNNATNTWTLNSQVILRGTGVTLLFTCGTTAAPRTCAAGELGANLDISGQASAVLSPPTSGALSGFTVIFDRNSAARMRITGNASSTITGTVYMPNGVVGLNGNGCIDTYSVLFVAGTLVPNGNSSCLNMTYVPSEAAQLQPDQLHLSK